MIFYTLNSTYEIDADGQRIRRLTGVNEPCFLTGKDGEWQPYAELVHLAAGSCAVVRFDETEFLRTSTVQSVEAASPPLSRYEAGAANEYCQAS